jgi:hypothetical protein
MDEQPTEADAKQVDKAVTEMSLGELKDFVRQHGHEIGIEVTHVESFNTKYTSLPRGQVISAPEEPEQ